MDNALESDGSLELTKADSEDEMSELVELNTEAEDSGSTLDELMIGADEVAIKLDVPIGELDGREEVKPPWPSAVDVKPDPGTSDVSTGPISELGSMLVELGRLIVDVAPRLEEGTKVVEVAITRLDTRSPGMTVVVTVFVIVLLLVTLLCTC